MDHEVAEHDAVAQLMSVHGALVGVKWKSTQQIRHGVYRDVPELIAQSSTPTTATATATATATNQSSRTRDRRALMGRRQRTRSVRCSRHYGVERVSEKTGRDRPLVTTLSNFLFI